MLCAVCAVVCLLYVCRCVVNVVCVDVVCVLCLCGCAPAVGCSLVLCSLGGTLFQMQRAWEQVAAEIPACFTENQVAQSPIGVKGSRNSTSTT